MTDPLAVLRAAAAHGLPGITAPQGQGRAVGADAVAIAANLRIEGLLWSALEAGVLTAADDTRETARESFVRAATRSLQVEGLAAHAIGALDAAGIEVRALKGIAIANLDHVDPSERSFADADLLGCPVRLTVGKKTLEDGAVDVRDRAGGGERRVPAGDAVGAVRELLG